MIPLFKVYMSEEAIERCNKVLRSGYVAQGPVVDEFEQKLRDLLQTNNVAVLNSCTSALSLAYHIIKEENKLPDSTEVLCTPVTCWATNMTVLQNNMKIKWCDIDNNCNISLDDVEQKLSENTRILSIVHWAGRPLDLDRIKNIKNSYRAKYGKQLVVVEDAAHSFGSKYNNKYIGSVDPENYVCFSFQAIKSLTTGDGGCLITPDFTYKKARLLRWFSIDRDNNHSFRHGSDISNVGFKYQMCDVNAALGVGNLAGTLLNIEKHKDNALFYNRNIHNPLIKKCLPNDQKYESSYFMYTILVDDKNKFITYMKDRGVEVNPVHTRNDKLSVAIQFSSNLTNVTLLENRRCCIPVGWWLSKNDRQLIVDACNEYI